MLYTAVKTFWLMPSTKLWTYPWGNVKSLFRVPLKLAQMNASLQKRKLLSVKYHSGVLLLTFFIHKARPFIYFCKPALELIESACCVCLWWEAVVCERVGSRLSLTPISPPHEIRMSFYKGMGFHGCSGRFHFSKFHSKLQVKKLTFLARLWQAQFKITIQ